MSNNIKQNKKISRDHKLFAKNSIYSFLITYSNYFGAMVTSFLMARLVTQEAWGFLIIATSIIAIFSLVETFLPPGLGFSLNYYIPRYLALNQKNKLKSFVKTSIIIRVIVVLSTFLVSFIIFISLLDIFRISLENHVNLLIILSPIIIIEGIDKFFNEINRGFSLFNIIFILNLIKFTVNIGALLYFFLFFDIIQIEIVAIINVISITIPFLVNIFIIFRKLSKLRTTEEKKLSFKSILKKSSIYGSQLSLHNFVNRLSNEFRIQMIPLFETTEIVTGYNLANHYREISTGSVGSLGVPLTISFSGFYALKQFDQIKKLYRILFKYSALLLLLVTGCLVFFSDFFIFLIYGSGFLKFSLLFKIVLISIIFSLQRNYFFSLLKASDKIKFLNPLSIIFSFINTFTFVIGLIFFGIIGAVILSTIGSIINFIISSILCVKLFKIKLDVLKYILIYSSFFIALTITNLLEGLVLSNFNFLILKGLNLLYFKKFNIFSLAVFSIIYIVLILIFKIFTRSDIDILGAFFNKDTFLQKNIRKGLNILRKFVWD
ncbi:MAG: oligosaccharide flippase family protein [Candidatus Thorarchaeota archaeon]